MACETLLNTGRTLIISTSPTGTCEDSPLDNAGSPDITDWEVIGAVQSSNENINQRLTTANVENESLTISETLGLDFEVTLSTLDVIDVATKSSQQALRNAIVSKGLSSPPESEKRWVRVWDKALNEYRFLYAICQAPSRSGEVEGNRTAEFTFTGIPTGQNANPAFQWETVPTP